MIPSAHGEMESQGSLRGTYRSFSVQYSSEMEHCSFVSGNLKWRRHVKDIDFFTTLAGYIHWKLTGQKVLGIGDASGMFPIDPETKQYHAAMIQKFDLLVADKNYPWKLKDILPKILVAGENAGILTPEGAKLLVQAVIWKQEFHFVRRKVTREPEW